LKFPTLYRRFNSLEDSAFFNKLLKELEKENSKLKRLVAELSLEKQVLKDIAEGNF
jgi:hypothetical protein